MARTQLDLFDSPRRPSTKGMTRRDDHATSVEAAERIAPKLSELQARVLVAIRDRGPICDGELESLPRFAESAPSTIRKRRGELVALGLVEECGRTEFNGSSMKVWRVKP